MADIQGILTALALSGLVAHPQGHNIRGQELEVPVHVDYKNAVEQWDTPDRRKDVMIHGGGFRGQGLLAQLAQGSGKEDDVRYANAIYKLLYPLTMKNVTGNKSKGDIENMEQLSGNKQVGKLLALSALLDIIQAQKPKRNWNVDFDVIDGAPGLLYNRRF